MGRQALSTLILLIYSQVSFAQLSCKNLLQEAPELTAEVLSHLHDEVEEMSQFLKFRQTNMKTEGFLGLVGQTKARLLELKPQIEESSDRLLKGEYNTAVLQLSLFHNVDDFQVGFIRKPEMAKVLSPAEALALLIERKSSDHYKYLVMEFYALLASNIKELQPHLENITTREQFEIAFLLAFNGSVDSNMLDLVSSLKNQWQAKALKYLFAKGVVAPGTVNFALNIDTHLQLKVFKVALDYQVTDESFYQSILGEIETDAQASEALRKIKARLID